MFLKKVTLLRDKIADFDRFPFTIPAINQMDLANLLCLKL